MWQRCTNPDAHAYERYGGRGITVCPRWKSYEKFLADMGEKPDGLTLERKDNRKGYTPTNCKWATYKEQANNRRNTRLTDDDRAAIRASALSIYELAKAYGVTMGYINELKSGKKLPRSYHNKRNTGG
jgi:hypothetical protein